MNDLPIVNFHFKVEWGGARIGFTEVTGLKTEQEVLEYRDGADPEYRVRKIPGLRKFSNITLKRGMYHGDNEFYEWYNSILLNTVEKRDLTIMKLDEQHNPIVIWKVKSAWPVKLRSTSLHATNCEVAIESLEITHEGFKIEHV